MERLQPRKIPHKKEEMNKNFLSVMFGKEFIDKELSDDDEEKLELFEKGLLSTIDKQDPIEKAIEKIVKTALACEFGPSFVVQKGAERMIKTISHGIITDAQLRKQALIIMDKFASPKASKRIKMPASRKVN